MIHPCGLFHCLLLVTLRSALSVRRKADGASDGDYTHTYNLGVHGRLTYKACRWSGQGPRPGPKVSPMFEKLLGSHWHKRGCEMLKQGTQWPDCPTIPEQISTKHSCLYGVPLHVGMMEMAWQTVTPSKRVAPDFKVHEMSPWRAAEQHKHASPLLPIHDGVGKHVALVSHRQLRDKMIQQAFEWHCKAMILLDQSTRVRTETETLMQQNTSMTGRKSDKWIRSKSEKEEQELRKHQSHMAEIGFFFFGKILHGVHDSFSMSHVKRSTKVDTNVPVEETVLRLEEAPINKTMSMDDVEWRNHAWYDSTYEEDSPKEHSRFLLSRKATGQVLNVLAAFTEHLAQQVWNDDKFRFSEKEYSYVKPAMKEESLTRLGKVLCEHVWVYEDLDAGAGGSEQALGMNGNNSEWAAQAAADDEQKKIVREKFTELIDKIEVLRKAAKLAIDKDIPFTYPGPDDEDFCQHIKKFPPACQFERTLELSWDHVAQEDVDSDWEFIDDPDIVEHDDTEIVREEGAAEPGIREDFNTEVKKM